MMLFYNTNRSLFQLLSRFKNLDYVHTHVCLCMCIYNKYMHNKYIFLFIRFSRIFLFLFKTLQKTWIKCLGGWRERRENAGERLMRATRKRVRRTGGSLRFPERFDCYTSTAGIVIVATSWQPRIRLICMYSCNPEVRPFAHSQVYVRARAGIWREYSRDVDTDVDGVVFLWPRAIEPVA